MRTTSSSSRGLRLLPAIILLMALAAGVFPATQRAYAATPSELFFSEYVEGSSFNKALEIYNGTGAAVDLSAYTVELYSNGVAAPSQSVALSGSLAAGDVYVLAHATADAAILAVTDLQSSLVANFNGDDAVALRKSGTVVDVIGRVGTDPGTEWAGGGLDDTLRRQITVCAGDTNPSDDFTFAAEWESFAVNTFGGLGSHSVSCSGGAAPVITISATDSAAAEAGSDAGTFRVSRSGDTTAALTVSYTVGGTATNGSDYTPSLAGTIELPAGSASADLSITPVDDAADEGDETVIITLTDGADYDLGAASSATVTIADDDAAPPVACSAADTPIGAVQGSGAATPLSGQTVTVQGVIVGDYEGSGAGFRGFFLQNTPEGDDDNPATSDGIFVFVSNNSTDRQAGQVVQVTGSASEFSSLTQISVSNPAAQIEICAGEGSVAPTAISFPLSQAALEGYESMLVTLPQALVISEYFNYDRFGEMVLGLPLDGYDRFFTPTNIVEPGAPAQALAAEYALRRITLDDGSNTQNPASLRHPNGAPFSLDNRFRGGDTVQGVSGVLDYRFGLYRIQPTAPATYTAANPRAEIAPAVGGSLKVAGQNTLNFFVTLDYPSGDPLDNACGPLNNQECRGADDAGEFERQQAKLLAAIAAIDADILGLNELENSGGVEPLQAIVDGLNATLGAGTYAYISTGPIGGDAIKVGIIYKPAKVSPIGSHALLTSAVDPRFIDTLNRPTLAQTFVELSSGGRFTVAVNHLKSKGSACSGDPDTGDGQGNCNLTRTAAAAALVDWLASDPTGYGDGDYLIIGDLNSYAMEDPIDAIVAGPDDTLGSADDYVNLISAYQGPQAYSYVFDGQNGYLDHALASPSLAAQISGAADWHINADEPDVLDYDTSFKPDAVDAIYAPDLFRVSDHDPVLIGMNLVAAPPVAVDDAAAAFYRASTTIAVLDNDSAGETGELSIVAVGQARRGLVSTDGQTITYRHVGLLIPGASISDSFTYTVRDGLGRKAKATVRVEITRLRISGACPAGDFLITNNGSYELPYSLQLTRSGQVLSGSAAPGVSTISTGETRGLGALIVADQIHDLGAIIPPALCRR